MQLQKKTMHNGGRWGKEADIWRGMRGMWAVTIRRAAKGTAATAGRSRPSAAARNAEHQKSTVESNTKIQWQHLQYVV